MICRSRDRVLLRRSVEELQSKGFRNYSTQGKPDRQRHLEHENNGLRDKVCELETANRELLYRVVALTEALRACGHSAGVILTNQERPSVNSRSTSELATHIKLVVKHTRGLHAD